VLTARARAPSESILAVRSSDRSGEASLKWKTHDQLNSEIFRSAENLARNCEYSVPRMAGRFRSQLVKLRTLAGIASKRIIARGIIGTSNGNGIFPRFSADASRPTKLKRSFRNRSRRQSPNDRLCAREKDREAREGGFDGSFGDRLRRDERCVSVRFCRMTDLALVKVRTLQRAL